MTGDGHAGLWVDTSKPSYMSNVLYDQQTSLVDLISTHLLLCRITVSFSAPPFTVNDGYTCILSFTLRHREDPACCLALTVREHKGWPTASFQGSKKASSEALQLLECLAGTNCAHTYDYTPCGWHAWGRGTSLCVGNCFRQGNARLLLLVSRR